MPRRFGDLYDRDSAWGKADKTTRARARLRRIRYKQEQQELEDWARAGFRSVGGEHTDHTRERDERPEPDEAG